MIQSRSWGANENATAWKLMIVSCMINALSVDCSALWDTP